MEIKSAEFVMSNTDFRKCPPPTIPEYAFIGRSNVGKSSLINMLTGNQKLAKVSGKPGKTQTINHFIINKTWYLVDLPGYGYAQTAKSERRTWQSFIGDYIRNRENLYCLFILVDSRHKPLANDIEFIRWAGTQGIPIAIVFTKADKLSKSALNMNTDFYKQRLLEDWEELPPCFITSSEKREGRDEILDFIDAANASSNADDAQ
ncbi:MAG: YihA family ribosome biogenesis GTP-binding protein [Salinivirgaceae bacterium]|nr:YihA family ribosome biogenesis GTP-binding protein [Salinivirgaceae bacterium]